MPVTLSLQLLDHRTFAQPTNEVIGVGLNLLGQPQRRPHHDGAVTDDLRPSEKPSSPHADLKDALHARQRT